MGGHQMGSFATPLPEGIADAKISGIGTLTTSPGGEREGPADPAWEGEG